MTNFRTILEAVAPERPEARGERLYERFRAEPDILTIPILDLDDRPMGLIERNAFFLCMAAEYGRALYARRPISCLIETAPLVVEVSAPVDAFIETMLSDRPSDLWRGFIIVEDGRYLGVASALGLLRLSNERSLRTLHDLEQTAAQLSCANTEAQEARNFMSTVVENIPAMVFVKRSDDHSYVLLNKVGENVLGVPREAVIGKKAHDLFPAELADAYRRDDEAVIVSGEMRITEDEHLVRQNGAPVVLRTKKIAVRDALGRTQYLLGIAEDITDRKRDEARITHLAHYDALTDLPNRLLFKKALQGALQRAARNLEGVAVLCIDDHFKTVNDTLGHPVGDTLLQAVAERLKGCVREADTVARLGGDEFAVVQSGLDLPGGASKLAARIVEKMAEPFDVSGHQVMIGASVGIAVSPTDSSDPDALLKMADMALYRVKSEGRSGFHFFERAMDEHLQARRRLELDLRQAVAAGEFELHYQPLMDLADDRVVACEALLRWRRANGELVPPADFIPLAEEIGLIVPLGQWVLRQACSEAILWPDSVSVAVNISPVQFRSRNLMANVIQALAASGLAPERLELEITESVLLEDNAGNLAILHQLRALGVRISMDDFGTGYSSLSYLRSFPFDKIKIDQSFVRDLPDEQDARAIIKAITSIGASLGMTTTAEGVETQDQLDELRRQGCDQIQGYLINRPMPAAEISALLGPGGLRATAPAQPVLAPVLALSA